MLAQAGPSNMPLPPGATPEVTVIIVNWNTRDLLRGCLASVIAETTADHEIIVIDNASSDASCAMVRAEFPGVTLIANTVNRGFAAANNQGLAIARGRKCCCSTPIRSCLMGQSTGCSAGLAAHPDVGCVGCQVLEGPDVIQQNLLCRSFAHESADHGNRAYSGWRAGSPSLVSPGTVTGIARLNVRSMSSPACSCWCRGMCLEQVGPLDEAFFVYAEEADWCRRIRKAGWRCVFAPVAQIIHLDGGGKSTVQIKSRMHVQMQKSHLIYVRKHEGVLAYAMIRGLFASSALLRIVLFGGLGRLRPDPVTRARARLAMASLQFHVLGREPNS